MSYTLGTRDDYARLVIQAGRDLGITPRGIVIGLATVYVESAWKIYANRAVPESMRLPYDAIGSDSKSVGLFQQQVVMSSMGWWWGDAETCMDPYKSARLFFDRLARLDYNNTSRSPGSYAQQVQQSAFPDRYDQRMTEAQALYDRLSGGTVPDAPARIGDPTWLEDVLRPALGDRLRTLPGWKDSGVGGTMGRIWGVIWHHTGNARETAQSIRNGRPDLPGPLAQLHIAPDGTVTIVAVGPCNHAGRGSWNGLPTDNANGLTIGIECAWPSDTSITEATQSREPWPDAQIIAMRDTGAALTAYLGVDASHNISHHEWATQGPAGWRQGKWDPGNLNMDWFRGEITKAMNGEFMPRPIDPGAQPPVVPPTPDNGGPLMALTDAEQRELLDNTRWIKQQLGPNVWGPDSSLGKNGKGEELTLRDGLAAHIRKADGR